MSSKLDHQFESNVETIPITSLKETEGPRIEPIDQDHVDQLAKSIDREGLLQAISVTISSDTEYAFDIVDGRHRKRALEQLEVEEVSVFDVPGDRYWVVPTEEAEADIGIQSVAANALRNGLTQAEKGLYLKNEILGKIIEKMSEDNIQKLSENNGDSPANVRGSTNTPLARQILYHLDHIDENREDWKFSDELYDELERIRFALDIGDPRTEAEYLQFYDESPEEVRKAWERDEIGKSAVEQLRQIKQDDLREFALEEAKQGYSDGYSVRDLDAVRRAAKYDITSVNEDIINGEFSNLEDAVTRAEKIAKSTVDGPEETGPEETGPEKVEDDSFDQFKDEFISREDRKRAEQIADYDDDLSTRDVLRLCYEMHNDGTDFQHKLKKAIKQIDERKQEFENRKEERKQALEEFDFASDSQFSDGEADHLAPPVETENLGMFFHDVKEMDDEVADEELQLIFTSPPYFTQSNRIVERWWPEDTEYASDNITEENVDRAYRNYLDEMQEIFDLLHSKLEQGRYLILNISDTKAYGVDSKGYDIPADFSYLIRHKLNQNYEPENQFKYDATIAWDKGEGQTHDRNQSFFARGKPLTYHPNWRFERLLVFRKGKRDHPDTDFRLDPSEFQPYSDDVWSIENDTNVSDHEAGFTVDLPLKLIQLYSLPGDTIADPFGGYGTTLYAVNILNEQVHTNEPNWTGYAWENFASESADQEDYRKRVEHVLTGNLVRFREAFMRRS
jgi:DNA modification methylase